MNSRSTTTSNGSCGAGQGKGRPKQYVRAEAVQAALNVFLQTGFHATSVGDLVSATGLNRASLYAEFGDKRHLFLEAIQLYRQRMEADLTRLAEAAPDALSALERIIASTLDPDQQRGCLLMNAGAEFARSDAEIQAAVDASASTVISILGRLLEGIVPDPVTEAERLFAALAGLRTLQRAGLDQARLKRVAAALTSGFNERVGLSQMVRSPGPFTPATS
jgi:TetR/AcrR family transcriptional repressor of nem operon